MVDSGAMSNIVFDTDRHKLTLPMSKKGLLCQKFGKMTENSPSNHAGFTGTTVKLLSVEFFPVFSIFDTKRKTRRKNHLFKELQGNRVSFRTEAGVDCNVLYLPEHFLFKRKRNGYKSQREIGAILAELKREKRKNQKRKRIVCAYEEAIANILNMTC